MSEFYAPIYTDAVPPFVLDAIVVSQAPSTSPYVMLMAGLSVEYYTADQADALAAALTAHAAELRRRIAYSDAHHADQDNANEPAIVDVPTSFVRKSRLSALPRLLAELTGATPPPYRVIWTAAVDGLLPQAFQHNRQWYFNDDDLQAIAKSLGLMVAPTVRGEADQDNAHEPELSDEVVL